MVSFVVQKLLSRSNLFIFAFVSFASGQKTIVTSKSVLPVFSSSFRVLVFHFEVFFFFCTVSENVLISFFLNT